jgi:23S rRNA (adenine2503-C2)-methyltransferase
MQNINDLTPQEIGQILTDLGQPGYRATQISEWLYGKRAASFDQMTNLPLNLRAHLAKHFSISLVTKKQELVSPEDGVTKFLLELGDGSRIESVFLPHPRGATLCVSTQVGCAFRCRFCATGRMGLKRNLSPGEIVDQVNFAREYMAEGKELETDGARAFSNLVFMGMGEPLANYGNLVKAIEILINEIGIGSRRITVSTSGLPKEMVKLASFPYEIGLAISLNSPFDEIRKQLMPVAGRTPLVELMNAARYYFSKKNRMLTFEYVLIGGVNDRMRDAHELASLIREVPAKINLIVINPFPGCPYKPPEPGQVRMFQSILEERGKKVTLRKSLGSDILAGCGQLGATSGAKPGAKPKKRSQPR